MNDGENLLRSKVKEQTKHFNIWLDEEEILHMEAFEEVEASLEEIKKILKYIPGWVSAQIRKRGFNLYMGISILP